MIRRKIYFCLIIVALYFFMTPKGSVRFAVFLNGYPIEAFTSNIREDHEKHSNQLKKNQKAFILDDYPIEEGTDGMLDRWVSENILYFTFQDLIQESRELEGKNEKVYM